MDTTKIKETQMAKTPEELTADWKAGKLDWNKFYYIKLTSGEICIDYAHGAYFIKGKPQEITMDYTTNNDVKQILAPVPTYDEYKAMQEELAEHRHYCCCMENEVMRLDKAKLEEEIAKLKEKIKKKEELIQCLGSNIDELDVKKMVLIIENNKLSELLKECIYILNEYKHCFDVKHHNMTANIIDKANEVLK